MKRLFLLCLLIAAPVSAQQNLSVDIVAERAKYGERPGLEAVGSILNAVAWQHRADGWKLWLKEGGNNCPMPNGVRVSCDLLIHVPSRTYFDVFYDSEGIARPDWQPKGTATLESITDPIAPSGSTPTPIPTPTPTPVPTPTPTFTIDYSLIKSYIEFAAEQERQRDERILADDIARDGRLNQKLDAIQEKPSGGIGNPFTNRTFYELLLGGLAAAYVARQETTK